MKTFSLFFCSCLMAAALQAQIIHIPADHSTIQQGINAATPGDTVLVAEGRYYEQINFLGKKPLMVASHFLMDGDASHINNTIIDGSQLPNIDSASIVYFVSREDTTSILCGFTITNGKGTQVTDHGYIVREGGGIFIDSSGAKIINNHITGNHLNDSLHGNAHFVWGAGLVCTWKKAAQWVVIDYNVIDNNSCFTKGIQTGSAGMEIVYNCRITNNTISDNTCIGRGTSSVYGAGFCCAIDPAWSLPVTAIVKHNIIKNNLCDAQNNFAHSAGGLFQSVKVIFSDNEVTGNKVNTWVNSGGGVGGILLYQPDTGTVIRKNVFRENVSNFWAGGLLLENGSKTDNPIPVENNYFIDNKARNGAAFVTLDVPAQLQNNVFIRNQSTSLGGAIYTERTNYNAVHHLVTLANNSFFGNKAKYGGAICSKNSKPLIFNSVFWGDSATDGQEIFIYSNDSAEIAFSTFNPDFIHGYVYDNGGNLNADPLYADLTSLLLSASSSCIDKGTLTFTCGCGDTHTCPVYDITGANRPYGTKVDMGAYEMHEVGISEPGFSGPTFLLHCYPNPFTRSIVYEYVLKSPEQVTLQIFNNLGVLIAEPVNAFQQKGEQKVEWLADDLPVGIYYCRLQAGNKLVTNKIVKMH